MRRLTVLHTSPLAGGTARFDHSEMQILFHQWSGLDELPLLEGAIWAFIDWNLLGISGMEVCRRLRCNPLTARAHISMVLPEADLERGRSAVRAGADDYLIGSVDRGKILDLILATKLDDMPTEAVRTRSVGDLTVDFASFQARWRGKALPLMPNEFRLLRFLIEHPGRVFTRTELIAALGKKEPPPDERTVDVWIRRLRLSLRAAGASEIVRTVHTVGYVLDKP